MLEVDVEQRITANEALQRNIFEDVRSSFEDRVCLAFLNLTVYFNVLGNTNQISIFLYTISSLYFQNVL